jgi:FkbM family methyltransferase
MLNTFKLGKLYKRFLGKVGYQKVVPHAITWEHFLDLYFGLRHPFVLQVGVNDGMTHDSLHQHISKNNLPGLLVEPQTDVFERLKQNYADNQNLKFANVAVGEKDGTLPFYRIKQSLVLPGKEYKASSGSSFYREQIVGNVKNRIPPARSNVLKHISNNPDDYIEEVPVRVVTLETLLREHHVEKIDFILLDCQGHDYVVLKQLDFKKFAPDIINYEHSLLSEADVQASRKLLEDHGYTYFVHEGDTCAYKIT